MIKKVIFGFAVALGKKVLAKLARKAAAKAAAKVRKR